MAIARSIAVEDQRQSIPATMLAAVYRWVDDVRLETVPVPAIGPGELLVRVHTCGVWGTDLKKIATGSHSAPRIFGHETAGVVAAAGREMGASDDEMERAAVSSEGTSGRPPVKSVESVREKRAT